MGVLADVSLLADRAAVGRVVILSTLGYPTSLMPPRAASLRYPETVETASRRFRAGFMDWPWVKVGRVAVLRLTVADVVTWNHRISRFVYKSQCRVHPGKDQQHP